MIDPAVLADLPLARAEVDRSAHRRLDPGWLAERWPTSRVLVLDSDGRTTVERTDGRVRLALRSGAEVSVRADLAPGEKIDGFPLFLGSDAEGAYFAVRMDLPPDVSRPGVSAAGLRDVGATLADRDAGLLVTAVGLVNWHDSHLFSPRTGAPTAVKEGGWVREAVDGSGSMWPRTDPAVIMVVTDGVAGPRGRALLGRPASWPAGRYSTLAGFVEPGESAEMAVAREVAEESGVVVGDVTYVASQPWPFPGSIMLGFTALADSSAPVKPDLTELEDARWFTREEFVGDSAPVGPPPVSISSFLIRRWLEGYTDRG